MKALILKDIGIIALEEVKDPVIEKPTDAIVRLTMTTICGTDLHSVRGTIPGYLPNSIMGHEGVGIVEQIGSDVKNIKVGERVIVPSTIACGHCFYCKKELYSQCDEANPNGPDVDTPYYGGPITTGSFPGMQAEKVRVPYADVSLVKIPNGITDEQVILLSDILPTSYMAVENTNPELDDTIAVFGCGIVGQLAILCLKKAGVKKIFAIDRLAYRLYIARSQGAITINFDEVDPVKELKKLTNNRGPNKIIDAVGIDAQHPTGVASWFKEFVGITNYEDEVKKVVPRTKPDGENWIPGNAPSQVFRWAVPAVAKAGTVSIIGVYTELMDRFPIGESMGKNLTIRMGNCNHRHYLPKLLEWVKNGEVDLVPFLTKRLPFTDIVAAYKHFDKRDDGWLKVALEIKK